MRRELHYFDIYPKVVPTGKESVVTVKFLEKRYMPEDGAAVHVKIIPMTQIASGAEGYMIKEVAIKDGVLSFSHMFEKEQEHGIYVHINDEEFARLAVYAVDSDLYELTPLKGDFHVHSTWSDGKESPEAVVAYYREAGYDFTALTDHRMYKSSLVAQDFYKDVKIDLNIVAGEEIHAPGNNIHVVNFGGEYSINEMFQNDPDGYRAEVDEIIKNLDPSIVFDNDDEKYKYASCLWVYGKIREANGLAIFPHPHWNIKAYNVRDSVTRLQFANKCFDAFELVGGQTAIENNMQLAFYYAACKDGYGDVPILGCSDSHGTIYEKFEGSNLPGKNGPAYPFTDFYTIVFAVCNTKDDIIAAVKNKNTVAVETYQGGPPRVHGDYRLVSYALFLMSEYFPLHGEICREEGRLMRQLAYNRGESDAKLNLEKLSGRAAKMARKYFTGSMKK